MSTGGALYLAMAIGSVTAFALVLAYFSWQQGKLNREPAVRTTVSTPAHAETTGTAQRA